MLLFYSVIREGLLDKRTIELRPRASEDVAKWNSERRGSSRCREMEMQRPWGRNMLICLGTSNGGSSVARAEW